MFLASTFSYAQRCALAEHAYQRTRQMLRSRRGSLGRQLARHGVQLDDAVLDDTQRQLLPGTALAGRRAGRAGRAGRALRRLEEVLDDLEDTLAAWPQAAPN